MNDDVQPRQKRGLSSNLLGNMVTLLIGGNDTSVGQSSPILFRDATVLPMLFQLVDRGREEQKIEFYDRFLGWIQNQYYNLKRCAEVHLSEIILDQMLQTSSTQLYSRLYALLSALWSYSISVRDVRALFRILHQPWVDAARPIQDILRLLELISSSKVPETFFDLQGMNSGLLLKPLQRFPDSGYAFLAWIRFSQGVPKDGPADRHQVIYCFCTLEGKGIMAVYDTENHRIGIAVTSSDAGLASADIKFFEYPLPNDRWYHMVIHHKYNRFKSSEVELIINGESCSKLTVKYPKIDPQHHLVSCVGFEPELESASLDVIPKTLGQFRGQLGSIFFTHDVINRALLKSIIDVGPNVNPESTIGESPTVDAELKLESKFYEKCYLCYSPVAVSFDGHPISLIREAKGHSPHLYTPKLFPGTEAHIRRGLSDSLQTVGSVNMIFTLISHLGSLSSQEMNDDIPSLSQLLDIVVLMIRKSSSHLEALHSDSGFIALGHILGRLKPVLFPELFNTIKSIEQLIKDNESLSTEFYRYVMFNISNWRFSSYTVLSEWIRHLSSWVIDNTKVLKDTLGTNTLYDLLARYFSQKRKDTCMIHNDEETGTEFLETQRNIRSQLCQALQAVLLQHLTAEEFEKLLYHTENHDSWDAHDLLQIVAKLLEENTAGVCDTFESFGGHSTLYAMFNDSNEKVMHLSLRCLTLHSRHHSGKRKGKPGDLLMFSALVDTARTKRFDLKLFNSLLGVGIEELVDPEAGFDWERPDFHPTIKQPSLMRCILEMTTTLDPRDVLVALKVFHKLMRLNNDNRYQFMALHSWELLLLEFTRFKSCPGEEGIRIYDETVSIFVVLMEARLREKDGWTAIVDLNVHIELFFETRSTRQFDEFLFRREVFHKTALIFKMDEKALVKGDSLTAFGENFAYFTCIMEDFIFYRTTVLDSAAASSFKSTALLDFSDHSTSSLLSLSVTTMTLPEFAVETRGRSESFISERESIYPVNGLLVLILDTFDVLGTKLLSATNNGMGLKQGDDFKVKDGGLSRIFTRLVLFCINEGRKKLEEEKARLRATEKTLSPSSRTKLNLHLDIPDTKCLTPEKQTEPRSKFLVANDQYWAKQTSRLRLLLEPMLHSTTDNVVVLQAILYQLDQALSALMIESSSAGKNEIASLMRHVLHKRKSMLSSTLESLPNSLYHEDHRHALEPSSPISSFIGQHFMQDWHEKFVHVTRQSFKEIEDSEKAFATIIIEMKSGNCNHFKAKKAIVLERRKLLEESELNTRATYFNTRQQSREREHGRYLQFVYSTKHLFEKALPAWDRLWKFMYSEVGPWSNFRPQSRTFVKLDKMETNSRMRFKLKNSVEPKYRELLQSTTESSGVKPKPVPNSSQTLEKALSKLHIVSAPVDENDDLMLEEEEDPQASEAKQGSKQGFGQLRLLSMSKLSLNTPGVMVQQSGSISGRLDVGYEWITFVPSTLDESKERKWLVADLVAIHQRRYVLRHTALEFFLRNGRNYMINFESRKASLDVMKRLISMHPPHLHEYHTRSPSHLLKKMQWTEKWQRREISNFEYLMKLNTIAGRTYNDLSQYPVFPWILTNFSSSSLDVNDASNYRDLSKPIGALEPKRLATFRERYRMMEFEDEQMKYMYHAHYSTAFSVFHYLIRLEPYTSQFIHYQGGRLDQPDRMFHSIPQSWSNRLQSSSDLFELIPEFYYLPDFLRNVNGYNLGVRQSGETLDSVILPPWAETAEDFIRIHREALESEYVSAHLHEWIDLIFGYKQRGEEALKADNLFHYLTYEGSIDIDAIEDAVLRHSIETQIAHFGQTPTQLFRQPHPSRNQAVASLPLPLKWGEKALTCLQTIQVTSDKVPLIHARIFADRITSLASDFRMYHHTWSLSQSAQSPSPIFTCQQNIEPIILDSGSIVDTSTWHSIFALTSCGLQVFTAGHWDRSLKVYSTESGKIHQSLQQHVAPITAVDLCETNENTIYVVTGSVDCTAIVWRGAADKSFAIPGTASKKRYTLERKGKILYGHDSPVSTVAISTPLDCVATASRSVIILYSLYKSQYIRKIPIESETPLKNIGNIMTLRLLHHTGHILSYYAGDSCYYLHSVNGRLLAKERATEDPVCCLVLKEGKLLASAGRESRIVIRNTHNLQFAFETEKPPRMVRSLSTTGNEDLLISTLNNGSFCVYAFASEKAKPETPANTGVDADPLPPSDELSQSSTTPQSGRFLSSLVGTIRSIPLSSPFTIGAVAKPIQTDQEIIPSANAPANPSIHSSTESPVPDN
eukprot:TRINITY_DN1484_c0_g1_i13.p1 TRINITY_DN1484_c0_g1~~TRINITY_DN1484_c0_g1_i13.p1  ORF type:complete len:2267 (+),score=363.12 TRINITY_DN1484_c0_g1_i13:49-6849(+)